MQLMLKNTVIMDVEENGACHVRHPDLIPFFLRGRKITYPDFVEWAANRTLSVGRCFAKEILNLLRLSQNNRFAVSLACRGLSLSDAYWIRQEGDDAVWEEINLFTHPLSLFVSEVSLSGGNIRFVTESYQQGAVHTPELTTLGVNAKAWIRQQDGLHLHKVGKYEIPACRILEALGITHISYEVSDAEVLSPYLSDERREWIGSVGEQMVCSKLFTSEDRGLVTFEDFEVYCHTQGKDAYHEAAKVDQKAYHEMLLADGILNNVDRHKQNWGFFMDHATGALTGFCPLFDHDQSFSSYTNAHAQTVSEEMSLMEAALIAGNTLQTDVSRVLEMEIPPYLSEAQWQHVRERVKILQG
ncbi:MAG: hypothetical protein IJQ12_07060 [Lachnospiraceae bacterium]|nr:hypothetical protein [Lachnospiraceae bacterium]